MDLIKKIYTGVENISSNVPIIYIEPKDAHIMKYFLKEMHSFDTDLYYSQVIEKFEEIFNELGIGTFGKVYLSDIKVGGTRFNSISKPYGNISLKYRENYYNDNGGLITYYASCELGSCSYPSVKINIDENTLYYSFYHDKTYFDKYEVQLSNGTTFSRIYSSDEVVFKFEDLENCFDINIKGKGYLNNELQLVDYLRSLTSSYDIIEIYNRLCEISLGNDISEYEEISLCESKKIENKWIKVNLISIENGEIANIIKTVGNKKISYDSKGNWTYTMADKNIILTINQGDKINYNIEAKNNRTMDDYIITLLSHDVSAARKEVKNVKRRIKQNLKFDNHKKDSI